MIPDFNDNGYLPPGLHAVSIAEVAARFGRDTEIRRVMVESRRWFVPLARRAGAARIIVNGSFVTDVAEPNDVDCVVLIAAELPVDHTAEAELLAGLPFLEIEFVDQAGFEHMVNRFFATDRDEIPKGMIEIIS